MRVRALRFLRACHTDAALHEVRRRYAEANPLGAGDPFDS
jgi:hypothetical protein